MMMLAYLGFLPMLAADGVDCGDAGVFRSFHDAGWHQRMPTIVASAGVFCELVFIFNRL